MMLLNTIYCSLFPISSFVMIFLQRYPSSGRRARTRTGYAASRAECMANAVCHLPHRLHEASSPGSDGVSFRFDVILAARPC